MCCEPAVQDPEHIPKETGFEQIPLGIHELIDKKVWKQDPNALAEAKKED
jgi:hypothetical protein